MIRSATIALALVGGGLVLATPATAYDPCQRAQERSEAADAAVLRWINSHCVGSRCYGDPAELQRLREIALDARAARNRACA